MRRRMEQGGATGIEIKYNVTLHGRDCNFDNTLDIQSSC